MNLAQTARPVRWLGPELDQMRQGNVQVFSEAQTLQRVRDLVKLALVADQQTRVLLMREVQSLIEARGRANAAPPTS